MSLLKAGAVQVGASNTPSQNFHWRNLLDGLLRLSRGNAGAVIADVMTVNADNSVNFPGNVVGGVLGTGQTWQDMTSSRLVGVTYTNTTGKPIVVSVDTLVAASAAVAAITVDGVIVSRFLVSATVTSSFSPTAIVPPGSTYSYGPRPIGTWMELR